MSDIGRLIDGWFDVDEHLLFVIEFRHDVVWWKPHLMCILDMSSYTESMPFDINIGDIGECRDVEASIIEWRFDTFYFYMLNQSNWPIHWPTTDKIIETYYKGKFK
jgi:hypothetical protein